MFEDPFYKHAEKVYFGYQYAGFFERLLCTFWYLVCQRWNWILNGSGAEQ